MHENITLKYYIIRPLELLGRPVPLTHVDNVPVWPSVLDKKPGDGRELFRRVKIQTVRRPPSRREIESWIRVRRIMTTSDQTPASDETPAPVSSGQDQSQCVKLRVRRNSDDSVDSELTLSLPSLGSDHETNDDDVPDNDDAVPDDTNCDNDSDCDMFATSPVKSDSDDSIIFPPSPQDESLLKPLVKRRRVSWEASEHIRARLAESPGYRAMFSTPETRRQVGRSQIEATSPSTPKPLMDLAKVKVSDTSHLTMLCLELSTVTRHQLRPDPEFDMMVAAFYRLMSADDDWPPLTGCIVVGDPGTLETSTNYKLNYVSSETMLIKSIVRLVRDCDPDILAGYEVQMSSWGYLASRAASLDINLCPLLSRVPASVRESKVAEEEDNPGAQYDAGHTSEIHLVGRSVFNIWRLLRSELCLYSYTLENVVKTVLNQRRPHFSHATLTSWWTRSQKTRVRVLEHYIGQLLAYTEVMTRLDLLSRSSELARLFGIQLSEVFSRGSQYRVESSMLRLAKPRNYIPVSPSRQQLLSQVKIDQSQLKY